MTTQSAKHDLPPKDLATFGFARARDAAYDAVQTLWRRRKAEGWQQTDIAEAIDHDPGWVSRYLRGPGNWTLRTFGAFVAALDGEVEIVVHGLEDPADNPSNFDAYDGYGTPPLRRLSDTANSGDDKKPQVSGSDLLEVV